MDAARSAIGATLPLEADAMAGGEWSVEIMGPARITEPDGTEHDICAKTRWSFSGAGTFLLRLTIGHISPSVLDLAGDDATPMRVIRETIQSAMGEIGRPE